MIFGIRNRRGVILPRTNSLRLNHNFRYNEYVTYHLIESLLISVESLVLAMIEVCSSVPSATKFPGTWPLFDPVRAGVIVVED